MLQGQRCFNHTRDATRSFGMTNITLHRANIEWLFRRPLEDARQAIKFNGISDLGAGSVAFHVSDIFRKNAPTL